MAVTPRTFLRNPLLLCLLCALALPVFGLAMFSTCPSAPPAKKVVVIEKVVERPAPPVIKEAPPVVEGKGWLGVHIQTMNSKLAVAKGHHPNTRGVMVLDVQDGMPSERAGFKAGDIILNYEGQLVTSACQFSKMVQSTAPTTRVRVLVQRDDRRMLLTPTLTKKAENCACPSKRGKTQKRHPHR